MFKLQINNILMKFNFYIIILIGIFVFSSCEDDFIPDTVDAEQPYVVEGYIELSEDPIPAYVIITKSIPFFSEIGPNTLNNIFVKNATVTVDDGDKKTPLTHICLDDIPEELKPLIKSNLGLDSIGTDFNFCVYIDIANQITKEENRNYHLDIQIDDHKISGVTSIPSMVPLDSIWTRPTPGEPIDSFRQLMCKLNDPFGIANFYRYSNGYVGEGLITPRVASITDFLFDGKDFKFPMDRAFVNFEDQDPDTFQYFRRNDSIQIKWINIDQGQYDFWNTLEIDRVQGGPFASYIRVKSNLDGALGVWSGSSSKIYKVANP